MTSPTEVPQGQTVAIGGLTLTLSKITMGQLRRDPELHAAISTLQTVGAASMKAGALPSIDQLSIMVTIAFAGAAKHHPEITRAELEAAFDSLPFDEGFPVLAQCVAAAVYAKPLGSRGPRPGEAESPSSSISDGSTGLSSPLPAGDIPTSTS